jgi:hypothetical protein
MDGCSVVRRPGAERRDPSDDVEGEPVMNPGDEAADLLRSRATQARERLEGAVQSTRDRLEQGAQEHPMRTVLIAVGAGMLIGLILGLGRRRD